MTKKARLIIETLEKMFPEAKAELTHNNNFELLVAVVLSAQTTDVAVNKVTPELFSKYPSSKELSQAKQKDVEEYIKSIGLYRNKARHLIGLAKILEEKYDGQVPNSRKALESLPGVGRKTANVVLANAFGIPALAVDTHVSRVSMRLGIAKKGSRPYEVEKKLMDFFDKEYWIKLHHQIIFFGRYHCLARNPRCNDCPLYDICVYENKSKLNN